MPRIELIQGDCLEKMKDIPDGSIDLTVTSPPYDNLRKYNGNNEQWGEHVWKAVIQDLFRVTKQGGVVVWVVGDETRNFCESLTSFKQVLFFVESCGFNLLDTMIWEKPNYAPGYPTLRRYDNVFEYMFVFSKGKPKAHNLICDKPKKESSKQRSRYATSYAQKDGTRLSSEPTANNKYFCRRTNIWKIPNGQIRGLGHPAPFPEQLAHDHILSWSNEGDTVLDPFMGSGTTGKMAKQLNRNFIGIELDPTYFAIAEKRINAATDNSTAAELTKETK